MRPRRPYSSLIPSVIISLLFALPIVSSHRRHDRAAGCDTLPPGCMIMLSDVPKFDHKIDQIPPCNFHWRDIFHPLHESCGKYIHCRFSTFFGESFLAAGWTALGKPRSNRLRTKAVVTDCNGHPPEIRLNIWPPKYTRKCACSYRPSRLQWQCWDGEKCHCKRVSLYPMMLCEDSFLGQKTVTLAGVSL